ncbi:unnamed protein product [Clonostachys byssicola]|uniref:Uncharacterized protein n=1 Tax=Clonostachys byssicola TaxID=160290 RepID=A0A9N9XVB3_9HYPO|nr:unnamed protein product [Clonostachys byssicola]
MPSYNSELFYQDWRYAVGKEFTTKDGQPFPYAANGHLHWGDELKKIEFGSAGSAEPRDACVSGDGQSLAVALQQDIHIIDTNTWATVCILRGHEEEVEGFAFAPNDSNILVSTSQRDIGQGDNHTEPVIIVWDIKEYQKRHVAIQSQASLDEVVAEVAQTAASKIVEKGVRDNEDLRGKLERAIKPGVTKVVASELAKDAELIRGRIKTTAGSQVFSASGKKFVYVPGGRLRTNDVDVWDINIVSTSDFQSDRIVLHGHTDLITWTGWNHDESLFASVSWDETIRVWDANTGDQRFCFKTTRQNWTGRFSPDSKYFVATCGTGATHIYNMSDGSTVWVYEREGTRGWRRALDWHPNSKWLAVGGEYLAPVYLLDVEKKEVLQQRTLSPEKTHSQGSQDTETVRSMLGGFLGVRQVRFIDNGNKLAVWTTGDDSLEVYDLAREVKWRFARGGTDDDIDNTKRRDGKGQLKATYGSKMVIWEDKERRHPIFASVDCDGIRIWSLALTGP